MLKDCSWDLPKRCFVSLWLKAESWKLLWIRLALLQMYSLEFAFQSAKLQDATENVQG